MENQLRQFGFILGISIIIAAAVGAWAFLSVRTTEDISVTGSATVVVRADTVRWTTETSRIVRVSTLQRGYQDLSADLAIVLAELQKQGIPDTAITVSTVRMMQNYDQPAGQERSYTLSQVIEVNSSDVDTVTAVAKNTQAIIDKGVVFSTRSLDYFYSGLPETRVALLADAVVDAKARAESLAQAGGKTVGALRTASSGVVQVLAPNSLEVSDYGAYNTETIDKKIMVTVKATFLLK